MKETIAFITACKRFFEYKPQQTALQFLHEVKALTQQDKEELAPLLGAALDVVVTV
jgi:hypothetical protein